MTLRDPCGRAFLVLLAALGMLPACGDDGDGANPSGESGSGGVGGSAGSGGSAARGGGLGSSGGAGGNGALGAGRGGAGAGGSASTGSGGKAGAGTENAGRPAAGGSGSGATGGATGGAAGAREPFGGEGGVSPYEVECHGDTLMCGAPDTLLCLGLRVESEVFGFSCSNECATDADCSARPASSDASAGCVDFVNKKYCLLVCKDGDEEASCPTGMYCYVYEGSPIGYCLWR